MLKELAEVISVEEEGNSLPYGLLEYEMNDCFLCAHGKLTKILSGCYFDMKKETCSAGLISIYIYIYIWKRKFGYYRKVQELVRKEEPHMVLLKETQKLQVKEGLRAQLWDDNSGARLSLPSMGRMGGFITVGLVKNHIRRK
ncbi:hypothetical protein VNO77_33908 [Canavalia gladiata]|uniref:Uncharacterized protein n=1 Tax=Canavalia gladiata TaxID=3824 RepID=A0AAN9PZC9_CANGL